MKVLVSGSTGFIGSSLVPHLVSSGHDVTRLVRRELGSEEPEVHWDPAAGTIESSALEGTDGVVHLAGESAVGRWTARKKARILESRTNGTRLLCQALGDLDPPPRALICASGLDFYGDRGDALVSEDTGPGSGFLAEVTAAWEAATKPATEAGIRVVRARLGMVVGNGGGALARMLPAFRLGLGGPIRRRAPTRQLALTHGPRPRGSPCPGDGLTRWTGKRLHADAGHERGVRQDPRPRPVQACRSPSSGFRTAAGPGRDGRHGTGQRQAGPLEAGQVRLRVPVSGARRGAPCRVGIPEVEVA